jgi:hypothetical protein
MQHDNGNSFRLADRSIVKANFGKNLAGVKAEIARDPKAFLGRGVVRRVRGKRDHCENEYGGGSEKHLTFPQ